jgi:phage terminase large subunit-like protein
MQHETLNHALWKRLAPSARQKILDAFTEAEKTALEYHWKFWARTEQLAPEGDWTNWLLLAGRGFGKTKSATEWARDQIENQGKQSIAIVAATTRDSRRILVEGPSGFLNICPPWNKPVYLPSKGELLWPNGAKAFLYSAEEPERLRGPEHDAALCDELGSWQRQEATWDMLQFTLRAGERPQTVIATTPRPGGVIKQLLTSRNTVVTRGTTFANRDHLSAEFFNSIIARYEGTRLGRQELYAEMLEDLDGALWSLDLLDAVRIDDAAKVPEMKRTVVAVDPSGKSTDGSQQGIVVCGQGFNGLFYVIADYSCSESPQGWAMRAARAFYRHGCDMMVAERNFGGDMVKTILQGQGYNMPIRMVTASKGKHVRAEPIAALFEQFRVRICGYHRELEEQLTQTTHEGYKGSGSPDRMDAMVYALSELSQPRATCGVITGARY